jgi:hypothetical protein
VDCRKTILKLQDNCFKFFTDFVFNFGSLDFFLFVRKFKRKIILPKLAFISLSTIKRGILLSVYLKDSWARFFNFDLIDEFELKRIGGL